MPEKKKKEESNNNNYKDLLSNLIRSGEWLEEQVFPPLEYAIPGLVPEGLTLLVGPPKAGKSWLVLNLALAATGQISALKKIKIDKPRPTLYLALEDSDRRMQERCRTVLEKKKIPRNFDYITQINPDYLLPLLEQYLQEKENKHPLIILDTLGKVMPQSKQGESTYQRDYRIGSDLKRLVDDNPGSSIVVLHHDRKAQSDDFVDAVSGTHGLAGSADTILVLERQRQETKAILKVTGRDIKEQEFQINSEGDGVWYLEGSNLEESNQVAREQEDQGDIGELSLEVLNYIRQQPEVTTKEVVDKFGEHTRKNLTRLERKHLIERTSRGKYQAVRQINFTKSGRSL